MLELIVAAAAAAAMQQPAAAPPPTPRAPPTAGVVAYGPKFFASAQPNTALDMIARLPGFSFDPGASVRGFAGAAGNVLINGERPSTKTDTLADMLQRIPASSVARIQLIRGGAPGIDMQGRTVLANVILRSGARTELTAEAGLHAYGDGRILPAVQLDMARRDGDRSLAASVGYFHQEASEEGNGSLRRQDGSGAPVYSAGVRKVDIDKGLKLRTLAQTPMLGGIGHLNAAYNFTSTGKNEQDRASFSRGGGGSVSVLEYSRGDAGELGGDFAGKLGPGADLKLVALQSLKLRDNTSRSEQDQLVDDFARRRVSGESIVRATVAYRPWASVSVEAGAEGAFNFLDAHSRLTENGAAVLLPNARVRVEERRSEGFFSSTWRPAPALALEAGVRVEASTLGQSGDTRKSSSFVFPKPRGVLTWTPDPSWQIRARIEREVGQLDFDQFTASANLSTGVVNAGNANLEPERRWVLETAFERRFWGRGALIVTLSHVALQKVIDVIPVAGLSAVGNIGDGRRDTAEVALTAPLARLGMPGGLLKAEGLWLSSRVTDPTTGRARTITGDRPFTGSLALTNDVPVLRSSWSASLANGYRYRDYRINAVLAYRFASQLDLAWEYKPGLGVTVLAEAVNVTSRARTRSRTTYAGLRSVAPVSLSEQFAVRFPAYLHLRVRKAW